jgi:hypothetical protein
VRFETKWAITPKIQRTKNIGRRNMNRKINKEKVNCKQILWNKSSGRDVWTWNYASYRLQSNSKRSESRGVQQQKSNISKLIGANPSLYVVAQQQAPVDDLSPAKIAMSRGLHIHTSGVTPFGFQQLIKRPICQTNFRARVGRTTQRFGTPSQCEQPRAIEHLQAKETQCSTQCTAATIVSQTTQLCSFGLPPMIWTCANKFEHKKTTQKLWENK